MPLEPGVVGPMRSVPPHIPRPEYVGAQRAARFTGPEVKDADTIERMRSAGRLAAQALAEVGRAIVPGVTTDELDRVGHEFLCDHNAYPSTLGYPGGGRGPVFTKSLCTSLNEVICHGIPDSTVLRDGDICNIDITAVIHGVHGDTNATFLVGEGAEIGVTGAKHDPHNPSAGHQSIGAPVARRRAVRFLDVRPRKNTITPAPGLQVGPRLVSDES